MNAQTRIDTGIVNIRGKEYQTVALRVANFRRDHPTKGLLTDPIDRNDDCVVMKAWIEDETGRTLATGHSEEYRKSSAINRTSALENAETSAIGRALAAFGYGGTEFATADEVASAIGQQRAGSHGDNSEARQVSPGEPADHTTPEGMAERRRLRKPREKLNGPHTSWTALDAAVREADREIRSCGDDPTLDAYLRTDDFQALAKQLEEYDPQILDGGPDMHPEFEPLRPLVRRLKHQFRELENLPEYIRDGAAVIQAG